MAKTPTKPAAKAAAPAAAPAPAQNQLRYLAREDLLETFADNVQRMTFDGRTLRIEFCVERPDEASTASSKSGHSIPVVRLVLDLDGAVDLFNKINSLQSALERQGVIRKTGPLGV